MHRAHFCYTTRSDRHVTMKNEIRIFVFATVLPVLLCTAGAVLAVRMARQKMLDDERRDLKAHASLMPMRS